MTPGVGLVGRFELRELRLLLPALLLGALLIGCGGSATLSEYATAVEDLVTSMNLQLDADIVELEAAPPTVSGIREWAAKRMVLRNGFLADFEELDPPQQAADLHDAALEAIQALVAAEQALADRAQETDDLDELQNLWTSPQGQAARVADAKAVEICRAAQEALNSTADRAVFAGMPWVPPELQEVVTVVFSCSGDER